MRLVLVRTVVAAALVALALAGCAAPDTLPDEPATERAPEVVLFSGCRYQSILLFLPHEDVAHHLPEGFAPDGTLRGHVNFIPSFVSCAGWSVDGVEHGPIEWAQYGFSVNAPAAWNNASNANEAIDWTIAGDDALAAVFHAWRIGDRGEVATAFTDATGRASAGQHGASGPLEARLALDAAVGGEPRVCPSPYGASADGCATTSYRLFAVEDRAVVGAVDVTLLGPFAAMQGGGRASFATIVADGEEEGASFALAWPQEAVSIEMRRVELGAPPAIMRWRDCSLAAVGAWVDGRPAEAELPDGFRAAFRAEGLPVTLLRAAHLRCASVEAPHVRASGVDLFIAELTVVPPQAYASASAGAHLVYRVMTPQPDVASALAAWGLGGAANVTGDATTVAGPLLRASATAQEAAASYRLELAAHDPTLTPPDDGPGTARRVFGVADRRVVGIADARVTIAAPSALYAVGDLAFDNASGPFGAYVSERGYGTASLEGGWTFELVRVTLAGASP